MKYLFTQSEDHHIIIAEVSNTHQKENPYDHFLSKSCVDANIASKNFTDISNSVDYEGKVWMLTEDLA